MIAKLSYSPIHIIQVLLILHGTSGFSKSNELNDPDSINFELKASENITRTSFDTINVVLGLQLYQDGIKALTEDRLVDALTYYSQSRDILQKAPFREELLEVYLGLSATSYHLGNLDSAIKFALQGKKSSARKLGTSSRMHALFLNNLSTVLYEKRDLRQSMNYDKEAIAILELVATDKHEIATLLNNIGLTQQLLGEFERAISNISRAISLLREENDLDKLPLSKSLYNLAVIYSSNKQYEKAIPRYRESLRLMNETTWSRTESGYKKYIEVYQRMAESLIHIDKTSRAQYYLDKAHNFHKDGIMHRKYLTTELQASNYLQLQEYTEAIKQGKSAIKLATTSFKHFVKHPNLARQYTHLGEIYQADNQLDSAVHYFHQAFLYLAHDFEDKDIYATPKADQCFMEFKVIRSLRGKARALFLRYQASKDLRDLKASLDTYQLTHDFIKKLKEDITTMGSKQRLAGDALEIYEEAIETALALHAATADEQYLEKALFFAESNKAILLLESMNERMAQSVSGIPDTLLEKERQYRVDISYYEREINEENNKKAGEPNGDKIKEWDDKLYSLRREYQQLIDQFEAEYPKYYRLKYDTRLATIQDIRRDMVDSKTAFLEYFVGQKNIYLFEITKADFKVHQLEKLEDFEEDIREIQRMAKKPQLNTEEVPDFQEKIYSIYQHYLARALGYLPSGINRLLIVPDDVLNLIPFELLSRSAERSDFLIQDYTIGYTYSASLFKAGQKPGESVADHLFLGYAPAFAAPIAENRSCSGDQLADLENSDREVLGIQALLGGNVMLGTEANRDSFLAQAGHYRIIHLATHACMDEENPMQSKVFFADDPIVNQDLFNLNLSADLAVLSACNTGSGQLVKGDGVLSLSKGFVHAGCPSAVMSLWSVDDFSTSEIMIDFYDYLKKGHTKDKALRKAKLDFIASADKVKKHPFFWAAFVQMGDPVALDLGQARMPWKMILVASALALIGGYFIRRRSLAA